MPTQPNSPSSEDLQKLANPKPETLAEYQLALANVIRQRNAVQQLLRCAVEAAGGQITIPRKVLTDPPEEIWTHDDLLTYSVVIGVTRKEKNEDEG